MPTSKPSKPSQPSKPTRPRNASPTAKPSAPAQPPKAASTSSRPHAPASPKAPATARATGATGATGARGPLKKKRAGDPRLLIDATPPPAETVAARARLAAMTARKLEREQRGRLGGNSGNNLSGQGGMLNPQFMI